MLKYFILFFLAFFVSFSADCAAGINFRNQKSSLQQQLATASGSTKVDLLLKLSLLYTDSVAKAMSLNHTALEEATKINDHLWIARAYTNKATLLLQNGLPNDSIAKVLAYAEKAYAQTGQQQFDPDFYLAQAKYFFAVNDFARANAICLVAVKSSQSCNDGLVLAKTYVLLARISQKKGELKEFVEYLRLAEKEFLLCNDKATSGRSLISVGLLYNDAGMNDLAQKVLVKATRLCEKYSDSMFLGYLYCNISGVYKGSSPKDLTLLTLEKSVAIFTKLKDKKGLGYAQNMLGMYSIEQKKYNEALSWFTRTIQSDTMTLDWQGACFAACNIADVYMTMKKYEPILVSLTEAEKYMHRAGDPLSAIVFYNSKARFQVLDKDFTDALASFNTSLKLSRETGNNVFFLDNLKSMADLFHLTGDESMALAYFRKYVEAGDSVRNAVVPLRQQELLSELNSDQLIDLAVKEKEKSGPGYIRYFTLILTILGILILLGVSTKVFGRKRAAPAYSPLSDNEAKSHLGRNGIADKSPKLIISEEMQQNIWLRLQQKMQDEKYFLRSDLSLHDLAELLETNTSYLSKVINELTGQNFNLFLNQFRIEEACSQLVNQKQQYLSIEGIAQSVGFNSKSAFNAAFKKIKGITPSEFIDQQRAGIQ